MQARNKPADGSHPQKATAREKTPLGTKAGTPSGAKPASAHAHAHGQTKAATAHAQKPPSAQKGEVKVKAQPKPAPAKTKKKGQRHQQHDLVVTINLVSVSRRHI